MTGGAYLSCETFLKFSHALPADLNALRCQVFRYRRRAKSLATQLQYSQLGVFVACTPFRLGLQPPLYWRLAWPPFYN